MLDFFYHYILISCKVEAIDKRGSEDEIILHNNHDDKKGKQW
jgi:hypothetical protein